MLLLHTYVYCIIEWNELNRSIHQHLYNMYACVSKSYQIFSVRQGRALVNAILYVIGLLDVFIKFSGMWCAVSWNAALLFTSEYKLQYGLLQIHDFFGMLCLWWSAYGYKHVSLLQYKCLAFKNTLFWPTIWNCNGCFYK